MKLALAAAKAFNEINDNMSQQQNNLMFVLGDLHDSLRKIVAARKDAQSRLPQQAHQPQSTPPAPMPVPLLDSSRVDQLPMEVTRLPAQSDLNKAVPSGERAMARVVSEKKSVIPLEAAKAFEQVDANMNANDEKMLEILCEISSTLQNLVVQQREKDTLVSRFDPQPGPQPEKSHGLGTIVENSEAYTIDSQTMSVPANIKPSVTVQRGPGPDELLTMETVKAFQRVDATMNAADRQMISILEDIRSSLKKFSTLESPLASVKTKTLVLGSAESLPSIRAHDVSKAMKVDASSWGYFEELVRIPQGQANLPHSVNTVEEKTARNDVLQEPVSSEQEELARKQISETAKAFEAMDASMVKNDEQTLALLNDIKTSLERLVETAVFLQQGNEQKTPALPYLPEAMHDAKLSNVEHWHESSDLTDPGLPQTDSFVLGRTKKQASDIETQYLARKYEDAKERGRNAANAFYTIDTTMNANDEKMISILQDISASFRQIVEAEKPFQTKQKEPEVIPATRLLSLERAPMALTKPQQQSSHVHQETSVIPSSVKNDAVSLPVESSGTEQQSDLSLRAAKAFENMDAIMNKNDHRAIAILKEIRTSLEKLTSAEPSTAKSEQMPVGPLPVIVKQMPDLVVSMTQSAPVPIATTPEDVSDDKHPFTEPVSNDEEKKAEVAKRQAILETAKAFERMDKSMMKNDEQTLALLNDINSSLQKLLVASTALLVPTFESHIPNTQPGKPASLDTPVENKQTQMPEHAETSEKKGADKAEMESARTKAMALSLQVARTINQMDVSMSKNDDRAIGILREINASFQRIVEADTGYGLASIDTVRQDSRASIDTNPEDLSPKEDKLPNSRAPKDNQVLDNSETFFQPAQASPEEHIKTSTLQEEQAKRMSLNLKIENLRKEEARAKALKLSLEAARALTDMDAAMVRNDERALLLLREINESFTKLADNMSSPSPTLPSASREEVIISALHSPAPSNPKSAHASITGAPAPSPDLPLVVSQKLEPTPQLQSIDSRIKPARDLSIASAQAFNNLERAMARNDETILKEFREMSSLFQKLASEKDNGVLFDRLLAPATDLQPRQDTRTQDIVHQATALRQADRDNAGPLVVDNTYQDEFSSNLQQSIETAEAFLGCEEKWPTKTGKTQEVLTEIVSSLKEVRANLTDIRRNPPLPRPSDTRHLSLEKSLPANKTDVKIHGMGRALQTAIPQSSSRPRKVKVTVECVEKVGTKIVGALERRLTELNEIRSLVDEITRNISTEER